jgi:hypothetical protein
MEHFGDKPNGRRFIGILFRKLQGQLEGSILKRGIVRTVRGNQGENENVRRCNTPKHRGTPNSPKNDCIPDHNVVVGWGSRHTSWRVFLESKK